MPGQLWCGDATVGYGLWGYKVQPWAGANQTRQMLRGTAALGRGKTRLQAREGLSLELGPTLSVWRLVYMLSTDKLG